MHQKLSLGQQLREIADSKEEGGKRYRRYKRFVNRIADHRERVLLTKMAEEALKGNITYSMGRSLPPKELLKEGINFHTSNEVIAYW